MPLRSSAIFFASIGVCNFLCFVTILPYCKVISAPSLAGAIAGALTLLIPFGLITEFLRPIHLSSLYAGSDVQQLFRGIATQIGSLLMAVTCLKLMGHNASITKDSILLGLVFAVVFASVAIANCAVRACDIFSHARKKLESMKDESAGGRG